MKRAAPLLAIALVSAAVFWKFLLFGHTMYAVSALEQQLGREPQQPRGWFTTSYPHTRVADNLVLLANHLKLYNEGLKSGELRLWNPSLACGVPTYADPMTHPFYPPQLLFHLLFPPDAAYELNLLAHLFASGAAMFLLLRACGRSAPGALAGALVWMLFGYQATWFSTGILQGVAVFGPLALLAILRGSEKDEPAHAALAALAMGLAILGSHPQYAVLLFLLLLGLLLAKNPRAYRFATVFALLSVGIGLAAILTRLDSLANGYRDPQFDQITLYAEPWRLLTYAGSLIAGKIWFPGPGWEAEFSVYGGLGAASLAVVGALRGFRDPLVRSLSIAAIVSLAVAFVFPLAWLYMKLPILNFSPPSRLLFVFGFCLSMLAAFGFDAMAERAGRSPLGIAWTAAVAALIAAFAFGTAVLETAIGFALASAAGFAIRKSPRAAAALTFAALLFELLPPFMLHNWHCDTSAMRETPDAVRRMSGPDRVTGLLGTDARSTHAPEWGRDLVHGGNLLALYGVDSIGGFEAILPASTVDYAIDAGARISPAGRTIQFTKLDSPLLDGMALRYALLPAALPLPSRFRAVEDFGRVTLYENRGVLPRARFARRVRVAPEEKAVDPHRETLLDGGSVADGEGEIEWKTRLPDRVALEVRARADATLVLADADYPGWEATIDGAAAPIRRADGAFRAVQVPAGTHLVEFRFRPDCGRHGLIGSGLFALAALGLALPRVIRGLRRPAP